MNVKRDKAKKQVKSETPINVLSRKELQKRIEAVEAGLKARTWRNLETKGKFSKNDKISFIKDDMLVLGCDIGSETHYLRAIDTRGRELSRKAFEFSNNIEGFQSARAWALQIAAENEKNQIVLGLEPTGHYWFCLATWMVANGISVVQVNPFAVKQTKEVEDNSQKKDDRKDPKLIANLVKDGNYGMPYLPEKVYAEMRSLSMFKDQLTEDRIRNINRLHREMMIYFPEYKDAFGKAEGKFALEVLKVAPFPDDILKIGADGLREIWRGAKLKGRGYSRADRIVSYAAESVGLKQGRDGARESVRWITKQIIELESELAEVQQKLFLKWREVPHAENILEISGIGDNILSGILAQMGDIRRFDEAKEIQKLSGMALVACSSGKHKGETKISYRGRKRLRYWLFEAALSAVAHAEEFQKLHVYYTTRAENPLKKMQSLVVIACKILRIIFMILKTGAKYDPAKMLDDIRHPVPKAEQTA
jgi:transposase